MASGICYLIMFRDFHKILMTPDIVCLGSSWIWNMVKTDFDDVYIGKLGKFSSVFLGSLMSK